MSIGENIRECRGTMKQTDLAEKLGVNAVTVSRWENGQSIPLWYINGKKVSSKTFKKKVNPKNFTDVKEVLFYSNYVWNVNRLGKLKAY